MNGRLLLFAMQKGRILISKTILYWSMIICRGWKKFCGLSVTSRITFSPCTATSVRTIKRWLTGGYNAKSKNQNTLISGTWHGSHAGNKTACTPPRVACIDVFTASGGQESRWRLKILDYLYYLLFIYILNRKYSVLHIEYVWKILDWNRGRV